LDNDKYFINQNLNNKEEIFAGFAISDFAPVLLSIIAGSIIKNLSALLILLVIGTGITIYLRITRIRHAPGYIMHLIYRYTGIGAVKGRVPPGDKISPYLWE